MPSYKPHYINRPIKILKPGRYEEVSEENASAFQTETARTPYRILPSDPPQIQYPDGTRQSIPSGSSAEELYRNWLRENTPRPLGDLPSSGNLKDLRQTMDFRFRRDGRPNRHELFDSETENTPAQVEKLEEDKEKLHPLRRRHLQDRLMEIDRLERGQARQDSFTTRMYGKKDFSEEKERIFKELQFLPPKEKEEEASFYNFMSLKENEAENTPTPAKHSEENSKDTSNMNQFPEETPKKVQEAIDEYKEENPRQYKQYMQELNSQRSWKDLRPDPETGKIDISKITPDDMAQAIEENQKDLAKAQDEKRAYCNIYERQKDLERGLFTPADETANQRHDRMNKDQENWERIPKLKKTDEKGNCIAKLDHNAAYQAAKSGKIVKASYRSSGKKGDEHGHIAEVDGTKPMENSGKWKTKVPAIDGYNTQTKTIKNEKLSEQFSPPKEANMDYFIYKGDFVPLK